MIQGCEVPPVMDQGIAHAERCGLDVARAVHPVRIRGSGGRRPDVNVDVGAVRMVDQPVIKDVRALLEADIGLWMDTEMQALKS